MLQEFSATNTVDAQGNPAGGRVVGTGLNIDWQDGPLERGAERKVPNGAFVETVIAATVQRLEYYQKTSDGKFACDENKWAIDNLQEALAHLNRRTNERESRGVEGTHEP